MAKQRRKENIGVEEEYTTTAKGIGTGLRIGGQEGTGSLSNFLFGTDPRMDVIAKDSKTGDLIRLDNIKVEVTAGTTLNGVPPDSDFVLTVQNYEMFKKRKTEYMTLTPIPKKPAIQNQSIPQPAKVKDTLGAFGTTPSTVCKAFNANEQMAKKRLGLIHDRNDAVILQGPNDGRSPGVMIQQEDGKIYMFDGSAKQYFAMNGQNVTIKASELDTSNVTEGRQFMGFPAKKNPINDFVPQGTILTPQPKLLPNIAKLMNTILTITDIVDLIDACSEAVHVIRNPAPTREEQIQREDSITNNAKKSSWERAIERDSDQRNE